MAEEKRLELGSNHIILVKKEHQWLVLHGCVAVLMELVFWKLYKMYHLSRCIS